MNILTNDDGAEIFDTLNYSVRSPLRRWKMKDIDFMNMNWVVNNEPIFLA